MRDSESGRVPIAIAVSLALLGSTVLPGLACAGTAHEPSVKSQADGGAASEEAEKRSSEPMSRDDAYHDVLSKYQRLNRSWQKGPVDFAVLLAAAADLRTGLTVLSELAEAQAQAQTTRPESGVGTATVAPAGRARPSAQPSSEEDVEARERATDQWLSVPVPEAGTAKETPAHVSEERIRESCAEAGEQLACLERLWRSESHDREALQACLSELESILRGLSQTPEGQIIDR